MLHVYHIESQVVSISRSEPSAKIDMAIIACETELVWVWERRGMIIRRLPPPLWLVEVRFHSVVLGAFSIYRGQILHTLYCQKRISQSAKVRTHNLQRVRETTCPLDQAGPYLQVYLIPRSSNYCYFNQTIVILLYDRTS